MTDGSHLTMPLSGLILVVVLIVLGIFDLIVVLLKGTGSSISQFLVSKGFQAPLMVFAFGYVAGHLFSYMVMDTSDMWTHPNLLQVAQLVTGWAYLIVLLIWVWSIWKKVNGGVVK